MMDPPAPAPNPLPPCSPHVLSLLSDLARSSSEFFFRFFLYYFFNAQPEIVISRGYQVEVHQVVNKDGYILELHRIVNSTKSPSIDRKKPIFLQHGLTGTDIIWLIHQSNQSLGRNICKS